MADIRINSLPTTASASSSDDFLALDGATNGTRKLNAYSPTFGGNLTVSGNTNTFGSGTVDTDVIVNGGAVGSYSSALKYRSAGTEYWKVGRGAATGGANFEWYDYQGTPGTRFTIASSTGNATLSGNLTVSGTGNSSVAGTLLVATTTNSSNGKIQLADHTTSAGGIGFGADVSLYREASSILTFSTSTHNYLKMLSSAADRQQAVLFNQSGNSAAIAFEGGSRGNYIGFVVNSAEGLQLTATSATFAGQVTANNVITATTANDYGLTGIRTSAATNATARAALIQHTTSGDMVDGQGAAVAFALRDSAAVTNIVGDITCVRAGADNTGDIVFRPYTTGTANERMRVRANGRINFASLPTSSAGLAAGDIWNDGGTLKIV